MPHRRLGAPKPHRHANPHLDPPTLNLVQGHKNWVLVVAWSPDAQWVASGDMNGVVHLWDPKEGKLVGTCSGHGKWITSLVGGLGAGPGAGGRGRRRACIRYP